MLKLKVIAAACDDMGIGLNNALPWKLRNEMKYFERMTTHTEASNGKQNAVIMGRKTWQSIPLKYRPLKGRFNIVLSRQPGAEFPGASFVAQSLEDAIQRLETSPFADEVESTWVIGGEQIYRSVIESSRCDRIYLTKVKAHYECDTFFPSIPSDKFKLISDPAVSEEVQCESGIEYKYEVYARL